MTETLEIVNGRIRRTFLGFEDHGLLTAVLSIEGEGWGQGFGNFCFGAASRPIQSAFGMEFVRRILEVFEVDSWEAIAGQHCRIERHQSGIQRIGHIVKDRWFEPGLTAKAYKRKQQESA